jgi:hypothetical protein
MMSARRMNQAARVRTIFATDSSRLTPIGQRVASGVASDSLDRVIAPWPELK